MASEYFTIFKKNRFSLPFNNFLFYMEIATYVSLEIRKGKDALLHITNKIYT